MERRAFLAGVLGLLGGCVTGTRSPASGSTALGHGTLDGANITRSDGTHRASPSSPNCERPDGDGERWGAAARHASRIDEEIRSRSAAHRWARGHVDGPRPTVVAGVDTIAWMGTRRSVFAAHDADEWYVVSYGPPGFDPSREDITVFLVPRDGHTDAIEYRWGGVC